MVNCPDCLPNRPERAIVPPAPGSAHSQLAVQSLEDWLAGKHITIWGSGFDVSDEKGRRKAAEWMWGQMVSWMEARGSQ